MRRSSRHENVNVAKLIPLSGREPPVDSGATSLMIIAHSRTSASGGRSSGDNAVDIGEQTAVLVTGLLRGVSDAPRVATG